MVRSTGPRPVVIMVARDQRELDIGVSRKLAGHFRRRGWIVQWEDPSWICVDFLSRFLPGFENWSIAAHRDLRRWLHRFWLLLHPKDLLHLLSEERTPRYEREHLLRKCVAGHGPDMRPLIVGRSAGGVLATRMAEELDAVGVVVLGYPFRAPGLPEEPVRTDHLRTMRVPTLILQGTEDVYSDPDVASRYSLSDAVTLRWLETDHSFAIDSPCWPPALEEIERFLETLPKAPAPNPSP
jgi:hypothetical protein